MIKIYDALLTDIMPEAIHDADTEAYALTLRDVVRLIIKNADKIMIYKNFENLPKEVIDLMAAEWRTHYYDETLPIERCRELVKNTWEWYIRAGTDGAVNDMLKILFNNGHIIPWYDYGGEPYHAKITTSVDYTEDLVEKLKEIIQRTKKASTILEEVMSRNELTNRLYIGAKMIIPDMVSYKAQAMFIRNSIKGELHAGVKMVMTEQVIVKGGMISYGRI